MANRNIVYSVGFQADKSGLETIRKSLQEISNLGVTQFKLETGKSKEELEQIKRAAEQTQDALTAAFNVNLNTLDLTKFSQEINKTQGSFANLAKTMNGAGRTGQAAFSDLLGTVLTTQNAVKGTNKLLDSMAKTFFNTIKWSISSSILNSFTGTIQQAWGYTQKLDQSLNDIRIVTGKSNEEMEKFAKTANKAAKALGSSTTNYTNASLIYYQQGLGEKDVQARTQTTIKAANVTGQSAAEVSEQLTAVWNGYKVVAEEAELYVDKLAAVAATTAADLEELSDGMSKVASAANAMGVDVDQLSAQLATIVSVTRQDASVVGTALKTIFSRMGDLKVDGVDEFGVTLGDVSGQLQQMGIQVLDQQGNLRDMGTVIEEVAAKWGTWTDAQQQAAAVAIAGKRQYNNLIALFENWDMYESALTTSQTSEGTLQKQQDTYMDSIEAKLNELKAASEGLFDSLIDSESAKSLIDVLTLLVKGVDQLAQALGGIGNILQIVGGLATKLFSSQLTKGIGQMYTNHQTNKFNNAQAAAATELGIGLDEKILTPGQKKALELKTEQLRLSKLLTDEEREHYDILIKQTLEQEKQKKEQEAEFEAKKKEITALRTQNLHGAARETTAEAMSNLSADQLAGQYELMANQSRQAAAVASQASTWGASGRKAAVRKIEKNSFLMGDAKEQINTLNTSDKYKDVLAEVAKGTEDLKDKQATFNEYLEEAQKILLENANNLDKNAEESKKLAKDTKELSAAEQAAAQDRERMAKAAHFKEITNQITNMIGSLTMAASAMSVLSNAFKILNDDSLSTKEKVGQFTIAIISAAAMIVPTIMGAISTLKAGAVGLQAAFGWITIAMYALIAIIGVIGGILKVVKKDTPSALEVAQKRFDELNETLTVMKDRVKELRQSYIDLKNELKDYKDARKGIDELRAGTEEWKLAIDELNLKILDLIEKYPQLELVKKDLYGKALYEIDSDSIDKVIEERKNQISLAEFNAEGFELITAYAQRDVLLEEWKEDQKNIAENFEQKYRVATTRGDLNQPTVMYSTDEALKEAKKTYGYLTEIFGEELIHFTTKNIAPDSDDVSDFYEGKATIDLEKLVSMSEIELTNLQNTIETSQSLSEEEAKQLTEVINSVQNHQKTLEKNNELLSKEKEDYLKAFAKEKGVDENIFAKLAKREELNKDVKIAQKIEDGSENFSNTEVRTDFVRNKGSNTVVYVRTNADGTIATNEAGEIITYEPDDGDSGKIGNTIDNNEDVNQINAWIYNLAKAAYGDDVVVNDYGEKMDKNLNEIGSVKIKVNNQEMTINELRGAVLTAAQRQAIEKENNELIAYQKQLQAEGKIADTALFNSKYIPKNGNDFDAETLVRSWSEGTLDKYNTIIGYNSEESGYAEDAKKIFEKEITGYLSAVEGLSTDLDRYRYLTGSQIKGLTVGINQLSEKEQESFTDLFNTIKNPHQIKQITELMQDANWNSTEWITNFQMQLHELGVNIGSDDWQKFFNTVNSGMKQWVDDADKVRKNLAFIKNTISELEIGDVLSDEEYQQLMEINPTAASSFIRGAEGWIAVDSGKNIAKTANSKYQDLGGIREEYSRVKAAAATANEKEIKAGQGSDLVGRAEILQYFGYRPVYDDQGNMTGALLDNENASRAQYLAQLLGFDSWKDIDKQKELMFIGNESQQKAAENNLAQWAAKADQMLIDVESGYYNDDKAFEAYATSGVSLSEAVRAIPKETNPNTGGKFSPFKSEFWTKDLFTYFTSQVLEEMKEVGEKYREFLISEKEFWLLEMGEWETLSEKQLSVRKLLSETSLSAQLDSFNTRSYALIDSFYTTIAGLAALDQSSQGNLFLETYENAQGYLLDYKNLIQDMASAWVDGIEKINKLYEQQISRFETLNSILTNSADLIKLVGIEIEKSADSISNYYQATVANAYHIYEGRLDNFAQAERVYQDIMNRDREFVSDEIYYQAIENYEKATQELINASKEWIEIIKTAFSEQVSAALSDAMKTATGYGQEDMSQAWELEKLKDERYLDEVNKAYALDEFERQIQKSIDETDNISIQRKLNELKERELKILTEKGKLTQYDLDRANAEYELTLKQIALEEAQQTANKMKLTRDAMGNYTYQYVADQNAITQAEEELAAAQNNLYNLDKDRKKELIDEWFSLMPEYESKMSEAMATGNEELQKQIHDYYFGAEGILAATQNELNLMGIGNLFEETTNRILDIRIVGENGLEGALINIIENTRIALSTATSEIQSMFSQDGAVGRALFNLNENTITASTALSNLSNGADGAADILVNNLGVLTNKIIEYTDNLSTALTKLDPYKETSKDIIDDQKAALNNNTLALMALTETLKEDANNDFNNIITFGDGRKYQYVDGEWNLLANNTDPI